MPGSLLAAASPPDAMLLLLAALSLAPQGPMSAAHVNDPTSPGVVGDSLLSLDEAIRLVNGTLAFSALSVAEQAQVAGMPPMLDAIVIDSAMTPVLTLQAPLTEIHGPPGVHHHVEITGHAMPGMPKPTIVGGSHARLFALRTYNASLHGLRLVGGQIGVDARMPHPMAPSSHMAEVMHCEFDGQSVAGVRVHGTGTDESMVMLEHCEFTNMPVAFHIDDATTGGMVMVEGEHVHMDGVAVGCHVDEAGVGPQMSMFNLFRSGFHNGQTLARKVRATGSTQPFMFRIVHCEAHCTGNVLDVQGNATGLTMVHHHHSDFVAGPGSHAFRVHPRTAQFDVHGSEMVFDGDVTVAGNLTSPRFWQQNNRYRNGLITIDVDGALPNLLWNQYTNCSIVVPSLARSPVVLRSSELIATPVHGGSFLAPITLTGCLRAGGALSGFASEQQPAPSAFLGTTDVFPATPLVGTGLTLTTDLPFGIGLVWDIADSYARPTTTAEPVRFYGDPSTVVILPAFVLFQSSITVPIPNVPSLAGLEFYAQGISLPLLGQPYAPPFHLPRGQLVRLRA